MYLIFLVQIANLIAILPDSNITIELCKEFLIFKSIMFRVKTMSFSYIIFYFLWKYWFSVIFWGLSNNV